MTNIVPITTDCNIPAEHAVEIRRRGKRAIDDVIETTEGGSDLLTRRLSD